MEDFGFDIGGLLSEEEAEDLFKETPDPDDGGGSKEQKEEKEEQEPAEGKEEEQEEIPSLEEVSGAEEKEDEDGNGAANRNGDGSSPSVYSSIASALRNDGIFPDFSDDELKAVNTPDDFAELVEKTVQSRLDERQKRMYDALNNGVQPNEVTQYENAISYLGQITDDALKAEGDEGEDLRKQLIYNDLLARGYSEERAMKKTKQSFDTGSDIDDAQDALESLKGFYKSKYDGVVEAAKKRNEAAKAAQKKQAEDFRKAVLDDENLSFGGAKVSKQDRQKVYDALTKPTYKDPDTGRLMTEMQRYQKEHPMEFFKQIGLWFVLTDGGKNTSKLVGKQVQAEKNKAIKELGRKINTTALTRDGSLKYASGNGGTGDPLLSDGWKVGW